jgi:transposase
LGWRAARRHRSLVARSRPCASLVLEPYAGYPSLLLRARVSVSCTDLGSGGRLAFPCCLSEPLQEAGRRMRVMFERVAGIDVHKDMIKVGIRTPGHRAWTRTSEVLEYRTFYGVLQTMARDLRKRDITHVVMEASGVYTEPVYYALMEQGFEQVAVIGPAHAKALKGHKTDAKDALRLAELFECGLLRGSYIPPRALKDLRDLTRYRAKTVQGRAPEIQRLAKALESAGIKLDSVVSDLAGKSATLMIEGLIDGERRGRVLADLAIGRMRTAGKLADLSQALTGRFTDHHAVLCRLHLDRIALFGTAVAGLEAKIAVKVTAYQRELDLLKSITGFGDAVAQAWLAEIGPAPHEYFASCEKLACWVTLCPGNHMSAGKRKHGRTGDAGTYIKPMLVQAAWSAIKSQGRLQARYHKLVRRFGGPKNPAAVKKAILAVAHTC